MLCEFFQIKPGVSTEWDGLIRHILFVVRISVGFYRCLRWGNRNCSTFRCVITKCFVSNPIHCNWWLNGSRIHAIGWVCVVRKKAFFSTVTKFNNSIRMVTGASLSLGRAMSTEMIKQMCECWSQKLIICNIVALSSPSPFSLFFLSISSNWN